MLGLQDKFTITRNDGKQTPESRYFVLDVVRDLDARAALGLYLKYTPSEDLAKDLLNLLEETAEVALAHALSLRTIPAERTDIYYLSEVINKFEREGRIAYSNDANVYYARQ